MKLRNNSTTKQNPIPKGFKYIGGIEETLLINLSELISDGISKIDGSIFENAETIRELHFFQRKIRNVNFEIDKNLLANLPNLNTLSITNISIKDGNIDFVTSNLNIKNLQIHSSENSGAYSTLSQTLLPNVLNVDLETCTLDEQSSLLSLLPKNKLKSLKIGTEFNLTISELNKFENLQTLVIALPPFVDYKNLAKLKLKKLEVLVLPSLHCNEDASKDENEDPLPKKGRLEIRLKLPNLKFLHFGIEYDFFPKSYIEGCPKLELLEVFDHTLASYSVNLDVNILDLPSLKYLSIPDLIYLATKENLQQIRNHPRVLSGEVLLSQTEEEDIEPPEDLKNEYDNLFKSMVNTYILD